MILGSERGNISVASMISRDARNVRDLNLILKGLRNLINEVNTVKMTA